MKSPETWSSSSSERERRDEGTVDPPLTSPGLLSNTDRLEFSDNDFGGENGASGAAATSGALQVTIGGTVVGVLQLINKAHHMNQGEFDAPDEIVVHHAAKIIVNIMQWTGMADLAGSAALDLSMKIQAELIAHKEIPEGIRTQTTAGAKLVTITEANHLFKKQREIEEKLERVTTGKDLFSGRKGNTRKVVLPDEQNTRAGATPTPPLGVKASGPPTCVTELGRRVAVGHTLMYRIGARPTREEQQAKLNAKRNTAIFSAGLDGAEGTGNLRSPANTSAPQQRDIRDVMLLLQQMEGSWKAAREKTQKQEDVIKQLRNHLFEERKRFRVLHGLCVRTGLIADGASTKDIQDDAMLFPDDQIDDEEFLHRLNINEDRIRSQQQLVSSQDAFLQLEREKIASQGVRRANEEQAAERRAKELAALRSRPFDESVSRSTELQVTREHSHRKKVLLQKESVNNKTQRQAIEHRLEVEKQRKLTVKKRLASMVKQHNGERDKLLDLQRQDTEDLYKQILLEDGQFEEALSRYLEAPHGDNPTPKLSYRALVDELSREPEPATRCDDE